MRGVIDQATGRSGLAAGGANRVRMGEFTYGLECYPDLGNPVVLLRVRVGDHTVVFDELSQAEVAVAYCSPNGLEVVATRHLEMAGYQVGGMAA